MGSVLPEPDLSAINAYWRAANYLLTGQISLKGETMEGPCKC